ncbi:MAG: hypothetical protein AAF512_19700, partial [Pseudomonadota bacterium]
MSETYQQELEALQVEVKRLRALQAADELGSRLHVRQVEFEQRIVALDYAAVGLNANGEEPSQIDIGTKTFSALISQVDVEQVKAIVTHIHEKGYAIVPNLLTEQQVNDLRDGMESLFEGTRRLFKDPNKSKYAVNQTVHIQNVLAKTNVADEAACHPLLRAIISGVLSQDFILNAGAVAMSPDPGCDPQALHR